MAVKDYAAEAGITSNNAAVRVFRAREALRKQVARSCGTCADHGCLDCTCESASGTAADRQLLRAGTSIATQWDAWIARRFWGPPPRCCSPAPETGTRPEETSAAAHQQAAEQQEAARKQAAGAHASHGDVPWTSSDGPTEQLASDAAPSRARSEAPRSILGARDCGAAGVRQLLPKTTATSARSSIVRTSPPSPS